MDSVDSDSNVVSIESFKQKKEEEVQGIIDKLGLEQLIDDLTSFYENTKFSLDMEDAPTYADWVRLEKTLDIFDDMLDHLWANQAVQYEPPLFDMAGELRNIVKNMRHMCEGNTK
jgi:hypothetical protein